MPAKRQRQKRGAPKLRRVGNRVHKTTEYYENRYPEHKIGRILSSNGFPAAQSWAALHACSHILTKIVNRRKAA